MEEIHQSNTPFQEGISIKKIIGTKVLAKNGHEIGKVSDIYVLGKRLEIEGIRIHRGVLEEDQIIGRSLIGSFNTDAVVLMDVPVTEIKGLPVYDSGGEYVGRVASVHRMANTNRIKKLDVERGLGKSSLVVPPEQIDHVAEKVFLNVKV